METALIKGYYQTRKQYEIYVDLGFGKGRWQSAVQKRQRLGRHNGCRTHGMTTIKI